MSKLCKRASNSQTYIVNNLPLRNWNCYYVSIFCFSIVFIDFDIFDATNDIFNVMNTRILKSTLLC